MHHAGAVQALWERLLGGSNRCRIAPARRARTVVGVSTPVDRDISDIDVVEELSKSFVEYSLSVIMARALPDVRDGLKPVHRRVLYSMSNMRLFPSRDYTKCAAVVGDVMRFYHPHGDAAIYEALVRLAQPWSMRLELVDGHGNFGSPDMGPAASRYTECRMSEAAVAMTADIDEGTVDMVTAYDGKGEEPSVLPAAFPNLLVNGSYGIAVGMATNMAPHNLGEVVAGLRAMLADPEISLAEMMRYIPGPDLPTGAIIHGLDQVREAYATGRGIFKMRAKATIEDVSARKRGIVVTELPYGVGPEKVVAKIKEMVNAKRLLGVADVKDLTDRKRGTRLVIDVKTGFKPEAVLDSLYRLTPLEESFGINNVALVGNEPRTLGLLELCRHYLDHRFEVLRRRSSYRLRRAEARAHIVEGFIKALASIDEVVDVIRKAKDSAAARKALMKSFELSEIQAEHILDMPLRRLTSLEVTKLRDELAELTATIADLKDLLGSDQRMRSTIASELDKMVDAFGSPRRTQLIDGVVASAAITSALEVPDVACRVTLSSSGLLGRVDATEGCIPAFKAKPGRHDLVASSIDTTTRGTCGVLTSRGRLLRIEVMELPILDQKSRGGQVAEFVALEASERAVALVSLTKGLVLLSAGSVLKRVSADSLPSRDGAVVIGLKDGDELVGAAEVEDANTGAIELFVVTSDAQLLRTGAGDIRPQGAAAGGVGGMRLSGGARIVAFAALDAGALDKAVVVTVSNAGSVKLTPAAEYPAKGRTSGGVRCQTFRKDEDELGAAWIGPGVPLALTANGAAVTLPSERGRRDGSGVKLDAQIAFLGTPRR